MSFSPMHGGGHISFLGQSDIVSPTRIEIQGTHRHKSMLLHQKQYFKSHHSTIIMKLISW